MPTRGDEVTSAMKSVEAGANLTDLDVGRHWKRAQKDITDMKTLSMSGVTNKKAVADAEHTLDAALWVRQIQKVRLGWGSSTPADGRSKGRSRPKPTD